MYLVIIAVLSTAHAKVAENAKMEFKVSKARVVQHYEMTVENELLPARVSLIQLILTGLIRVLHACYQWVLSFLSVGNAEQERGIDMATRKCFGQTVFWLVIGPLAVVAGDLMWILSVSYAPYVWTKYYIGKRKQPLRSQIPSLALQWFVIVVWCGMLAPLFLVVVWLWAPLWSALKWLKDGFCHEQGSEDEAGLSGDIGEPESFVMNKIRRKVPGAVGARDLYTYLVDPMSDPEVRQNEINRHSTVEHIKLLRNRLENKSKEQMDDLGKETRRQMEQKLDRLREKTRRQMNELRKETRHMEEKLDKIMLILENVAQVTCQGVRSTKTGQGVRSTVRASRAQY